MEDIGVHVEAERWNGTVDELDKWSLLFTHEVTSRGTASSLGFEWRAKLSRSCISYSSSSHSSGSEHFIAIASQANTSVLLVVHASIVTDAHTDAILEVSEGWVLSASVPDARRTSGLGEMRLACKLNQVRHEQISKSLNWGEFVDAQLP